MNTKIKRLIFDIETSPCIGLFWRPGWKISISHDNIVEESAIMCICWKWEGEKKIYSSQWDKGDDKQCVADFLKVALEADELVAHNGDQFDVKWVNTRCLHHNLGPLPIWKTVDTLAIARRRFKFNSNRLDYLGKFLFGEGKIHTSFDLWKDILLKDSKKAMKEMVKYCKKDVELLEKVYHALQPYHGNKTHVGALNGEEKWTCPHDGSANICLSKRTVTAGGAPRFQMQCKDCGKYFTISNTEYKKWREFQV
jgi:DNA polymerase elongation subunit (family B)